LGAFDHAVIVAECRAASSHALPVATLDKKRDAIAKRGYLIAESHDPIGITDIGAPILDRQGRALAGVTVTYMNRRGSPPQHEQVLQLLLQTCRSIGEALK
jgi:DNA-binding IclR family transcriptional regulator